MSYNIFSFICYLTYCT